MRTVEKLFLDGCPWNMLYWTLRVSLKKHKGTSVYTFLSPEGEQSYMSMWLRPLNLSLQLLIFPTFYRVK